MMKKRSWMWVGIAQAVLFVALAIILAFPTVNKTFGFSDFILVPLPAARMIAFSIVYYPPNKI